MGLFKMPEFLKSNKRKDRESKEEIAKTQAMAQMVGSVSKALSPAGLMGGKKAQARHGGEHMLVVDGSTSLYPDSKDLKKVRKKR